MNFNQFLKKTEKLIVDNSPGILTAIGVTGVVTTAYLSGKASFKAADVLWHEQNSKDLKERIYEPLSVKERFNLVWKLYIPAAGTGLLTISAIIGANHIGTRRAAAVAAAYSISEKAWGEYKDKVVERLGEKKETAIRDEVAQDRVRANPPSQSIFIATGKSLCYDLTTDRYFESSMEDIKHAQNRLNHKMVNQMGGASLNDWYDMVGLGPVPWGEEVGWNGDQLVELRFTSVIADNDERSETALAVDFDVAPVRGYFRANQ